MKALVALAWATGFYDFAGVTLLAFYGLGRIGEVLGAVRKDLLLPEEDLWQQGVGAYLRLGSSKTATRGRGRVQHLRIDNPPALKLIAAAFAGIDYERRLFVRTPSAYRYRWNKLMQLLSVDPALRLTPGGLRGGGAVWCYRNGVGVADIQWRMRLKHQSTLEYYFAGGNIRFKCSGRYGSSQDPSGCRHLPLHRGGDGQPMKPLSAARRACSRDLRAPPFL